MPNAIAIAIIQARTSSTRLPGKVLRLLNGKPMIEHVIERVKKAHGFEKVVVATSELSSDTELAGLCRKLKVEVVRGPLENVALRFKTVLDQYHPVYFARICADSPLYDPKLMEMALAEIMLNDWDIVTNTAARSFPKGLSVEVMKSDIFLKEFPHISDKEDLEHVTRYFYRNKERFRIFNINCERGDFSSKNLSVDSEEDFRKVESILKDFNTPLINCGWEQLVEKI